MVAPPPMQCMITIDYYDGNRFLARQPRQSGPPSKTLPGATFTQQRKGCDAAKARILQRHLRNTRTKYRNRRAASERWTALGTGLPAAASGCSRERSCGNEFAIRQFRAPMRPAVASTLWLPHPKRDRSGGCSTPRHFRLAAHVSPAGNRSDTCETSRGTPLSGRMRLAIGRPRDPVAAISYENLPLKVGPILPLANRVGGCGDRLSLNFGSALPRGR